MRSELLEMINEASRLLALAVEEIKEARNISVEADTGRQLSLAITNAEQAILWLYAANMDTLEV